MAGETPTVEDPEAYLGRLAETKLEKSDVEAVLAKFAERNGLPAMRFDERGEIGFSFDDELNMSLVHAPMFPGVMACVELPEELARRDDVVRELLQANLSWEKNGGGTFGRVSETGAFVYCAVLPLADRDDHVFERELLAFAERAQAWLETVELALEPDDFEDQEVEAGPADRAPRPPGSYV